MLFAFFSPSLFCRIPEAYLEDLVSLECGWAGSDQGSFDTVSSDLFGGEEAEQRRKRPAVNDSGVSSDSRGSQSAGGKRQRIGGEGLVLQYMEEYDIDQGPDSDETIRLDILCSGISSNKTRHRIKERCHAKMFPSESDTRWR